MHSIIFIQPEQEALKKLKEILHQVSVTIAATDELAYGTKLCGSYDNQPVAVVLYFNHKKKSSSKIVIEKAPQVVIDVLSSGNYDSPASTVKKIPIYATIQLANIADRQNFHNQLKTVIGSATDLPLKDHMEYLIKLTENNNDLTITQFISGKLLVQGVYSPLVDKVADIVESIKPLSEEERALFFAPQEIQEEIRKNFNDNSSLIETVKTSPDSDSDEWLSFLFDNDKKSIETGLLLIEILRGHARKLPEYNFLVAIFAKAFEGFLIKLLIEKGFFTLQAYQQNTDIAEIGNALRKRKLEKFINDLKRYGFILEKLIATWEGSRCKEMHSDPIMLQSIVSVATLKEAIEKTNEIKCCIRDAFRIFIKHESIAQETIGEMCNGALPVRKVSIIESDIKITYPYIGTDESGKGDYFGPLVIAGVCVNQDIEFALEKEGIRDSKTLSDKQIFEKAKIIKHLIEPTCYSVVEISPEKYNQLYEKIRNLNKLLAWGHARAIENILSAEKAELVIADQFGDKSSIEQALMKNGKTIHLEQMPKAERHVAVAAASILAREKFLEKLSSLSKMGGIELLKGASGEVVKTAVEIVKKYGIDYLNKVSKVHFKTTSEVKLLTR